MTLVTNEWDGEGRPWTPEEPPRRRRGRRSRDEVERLARLVLEYGDLRQQDGESRAHGHTGGRAARRSREAGEKYEAIVRALVWRP